MKNKGLKLNINRFTNLRDFEAFSPKRLVEQRNPPKNKRKIMNIRGNGGVLFITLGLGRLGFIGQ